MKALEGTLVFISCSDGISIEGILVGGGIEGSVFRWEISDPWQIAGVNANHGQWQSGEVTQVEAIKLKGPLFVADHLVVRMGPTHIPSESYRK